MLYHRYFLLFHFCLTRNTGSVISPVVEIMLRTLAVKFPDWTALLAT
jgi:hypothetical protein